MNTPPSQGRFGDPAEPTLATCVVLRVTNDADMHLLITTGLIWRGGRKTQRRAIEWLIAHREVALALLPNLPPGYGDLITSLRGRS